MKSGQKFIVVIVMCWLGIVSSCKKEVVYPTGQLPANVPSLTDYGSGISRWGKFKIIDAIMYVDNHETGEKTVYNHFDSNKTRSSLRWGGSLFDIEEIIKDTTTYSFWQPINYTGIGKFVLNDDTTKFYGVNYMGQYTTIVEDPTHGQQNMGGSSRPFSGQTISKADSTIAIQIEEVEGSINGYNCRYWTRLTLKKIQSW